MGAVGLLGIPLSGGGKPRHLHDNSLHQDGSLIAEGSERYMDICVPRGGALQGSSLKGAQPGRITPGSFQSLSLPQRLATLPPLNCAT